MVSEIGLQDELQYLPVVQVVQSCCMVSMQFLLGKYWLVVSSAGCVHDMRLLSVLDPSGMLIFLLELAAGAIARRLNYQCDG